MNLYGIFFGDRRDTLRWQLVTNKREALAAARKDHGRVGVIRHAEGYGAPATWDAPTFLATMETIADFRVPQSR